MDSAGLPNLTPTRPHSPAGPGARKLVLGGDLGQERLALGLGWPSSVAICVAICVHICLPQEGDGKDTGGKSRGSRAKALLPWAPDALGSVSPAVPALGPCSGPEDDLWAWHVWEHWEPPDSRRLEGDI